MSIFDIKVVLEAQFEDLETAQEFHKMIHDFIVKKAEPIMMMDIEDHMSLEIQTRTRRGFRVSKFVKVE